MKIGDLVIIDKNSEYYSEQAFDSDKKRRIFKIINIHRDQNDLKFNRCKCKVINSNYTNYYPINHLVLYEYKKYKRKKLSL